MEMQGRNEYGIVLDGPSRSIGPAATISCITQRWHRALFHLERREFDTVLDLYDRRFRDLAAPLTLAVPDLYIDVQNAASMLFRLEFQGIDVGDRWTELADKAEARIGDCLSAFTLPHWMMAARGLRARGGGGADARRNARVRQRRRRCGQDRRKDRAAGVASRAGAPAR